VDAANRRERDAGEDAPVTLVLAYTWDFGVVRHALPRFETGVKYTILLSLAVMAVSLVLGFLVALARLSRFRLVRAPAYAYTEVFRTTPLLVQIVWFFWVFPITFHVNIDTFLLGLIALSLNVGAFLAEIFRGGILSIHPGQREAALATGMSEWAALRRIVVPQAFRRSIPLVAAMWISLFKDTSLVAVIGIHELMYEAKDFALVSYRPVETFTVAALIYFVLTYPQSLAVNWLFERYRVVE
jgi:polar amino acid transport system permease protein